MHVNNTIAFSATRALVRDLLERSASSPDRWSVQGFGMLRTYLDAAKRWRVNLWHSSAAVPGVSTVHDHPWDFTSLVVAGRFTNIRYHDVTGHRHDELDGEAYYVHRIQTGEGGGPRGGRRVVYLRADRAEHYTRGMVYSQRAEEIHESSYVDGTVTMNARQRRPDGEHANVFWRVPGEWVDAEPRPAERHEIWRAVSDALKFF